MEPDRPVPADAERGHSAQLSTSYLKARILSAEHVALVFTFFGGFFVFSGQGYYERLFSEFSIMPGLIEIETAQLVSKGVECTSYALLMLLFENWRGWLSAVVIGIAVAPIVIATVWKLGGRDLVMKLDTKRFHGPFSYPPQVDGGSYARHNRHDRWHEWREAERACHSEG